MKWQQPFISAKSWETQIPRARRSFSNFGDRASRARLRYLFLTNHLSGTGLEFVSEKNGQRHSGSHLQRRSRRDAHKHVAKQANQATYTAPRSTRVHAHCAHGLLPSRVNKYRCPFIFSGSVLLSMLIRRVFCLDAYFYFPDVFYS